MKAHLCDKKEPLLNIPMRHGLTLSLAITIKSNRESPILCIDKKFLKFLNSLVTLVLKRIFNKVAVVLHLSSRGVDMMIANFYDGLHLSTICCVPDSLLFRFWDYTIIYFGINRY